MSDDRKPSGRAPCTAFFFVRTLRQAAGMDERRCWTRRCSGARTAPSPAKAKLKDAIDRTKALLGVPGDYRVGIVPASDTGAMEMAMWSHAGAPRRRLLRLGKLRRGLGHRHDQAAQDQGQPRVQGGLWRTARPQAGRSQARRRLPWNGTTSGVRVPNADWIASDREGITICDATSAAFAMDLAWDKLDVDDVLLAEGAGRRGGARHAGALAARGGAAREPIPRPGRCRRSSA